MTLAYLDELYDAMMNRDQQRVRYLIEAVRASWIPREVREEVLAISRLPGTSVRAPIQLLRYMRVLEELTGENDEAPLREEGAEDDERELVDPAQLELPGVR
jgi:hypothetical protein